MFYCFLRWEGETPRIGCTRKLSAGTAVCSSSTDVDNLAASKLPKSLRQIDQVLQRLIPKRKSEEVDSCLGVKKQLYEQKVKESKMLSLQNFMNSSVYRGLANSEKLAYQRQMNELLGICNISDACSDVHDV